jgi:hypothetical protein
MCTERTPAIPEVVATEGEAAGRGGPEAENSAAGGAETGPAPTRTNFL